MTQVTPAGWPRGSGYAHGIVAEGRTIFLAGQIGWDPVTHRVEDGGITAQVDRALANIVTLLDAAGARPEHVCRMTWFITDRDAYSRAAADIGAAYRRHFKRHFPAMSVVVVAALLEPGALVEIEATAVLPAA